MNFMDKIHFLKKKYQEMDEKVRAHLIIRDERCPQDFLEKIQAAFPNLPDSYLKFLREYNGLKIDWISFKGSPKEARLSILDILENWNEYYSINLLKEGYFPIAEDAAGDLYCLNENRQIVMFDSEVYEKQEPIIIADTFESFMDKWVLGKCYSERGIENSTFHKFLKSQGWA